ncbi:MAG: RHS repeat-associated core domain-containing protein [Chloroflexota bacterium]
MPDALGSVRGAVNSGAAPLESRQYSPYGEPLGSYSQSAFGFAGEQTDANGLVYLRARYMNPATGMFLSKDPVEGFMQRPMSRNGYSYVEGNPVNYTDPSGEFLPILLGIAGATAFGAAFGAFAALGMYEAALRGDCGCDKKQWAQHTDRNTFLTQAALAGAAFGFGFAGAALSPLTAIAAGALGIHIGIDTIQHTWTDIQKNGGLFGGGLNPCNQLELLGGIAGIIGGVGMLGSGLNTISENLGVPKPWENQGGTRKSPINNTGSEGYPGIFPAGSGVTKLPKTPMDLDVVELVEAVRSRYPSMPMEINLKYFKEHIEIGEVDLQVSKVIIEVKGGGLKGAVKDVAAKYNPDINPTQKQVILYAPNVKSITHNQVSQIEGLGPLGTKIFRAGSLNDLLDYIGN